MAMLLPVVCWPNLRGSSRNAQTPAAWSVTRLAPRVVVDHLAVLVGPVQPGLAVEVVIYPLDVALGAGVFPVARPVPAHAVPQVAGAVIVVEVGDPAFVAGTDAGAVIVDVERGALLRQGVGA